MISSNFFLRIYKCSTTTRFIFGLLSVVCVLALNTSVQLVFKNYIPMSLFLISVVAAAWLGGISVGVFATFLGGIAEVYFYSPGLWQMPISNLEVVRILIYFIQGGILSLVFGGFRNIQQLIIEREQYLSDSLRQERKNQLENQKTILQAKKANSDKSLFLANMSHEIRTPLVSILGFAELLKDSELSLETVKKYGSIIERTGNDLMQITNDILDLSKVEAGKLEVEAMPFSLSNMIHDLFLITKVRSDQKGLELAFVAEEGAPDLIVSDPTRLRQILLNIVGNAIKFTNSGFVTLRYRANGNQLEFVVQDSGIGITTAQKQNLFKCFSQGDCTINRQFSGTGLGLALSRRLSKILGGDVILKDSQIGVGSTFIVTIPFVEVAQSQASNMQKFNVDEDTHMNLDKKRILLVDDSLDNQDLLKTILNEWGAYVVIASNGREAIEQVQKQNFDLILMDMQMPIMDGYSATKELIDNHCQIPIIALTANAMKEDRDRCLSAGCKDYVAKPIRRQQLLQSLQKNIVLQSA